MAANDVIWHGCKVGSVEQEVVACRCGCNRAQVRLSFKRYWPGTWAAMAKELDHEPGT